MQGEILFLCVTVFYCWFFYSHWSDFSCSRARQSLFSGTGRIARQPEATGAISRTLFVGLAMLESLAYTYWLFSLILLFANPFVQYLFK
jgi:hypothetical protein